MLKWLPKKSWLLKSVKFAGPAGAALEAYFNVKEGLTLLLDEDGEAWKNQGTAVGLLHYTKGWVLVGSVALGAGLGTFAAATATGGLVVAAGAFFTPLGIGLAVGTIIVVAIDAFVAWLSGPASTMADFDEKIEDTVKAEFDGRKKSRTYDDLELFYADADRALRVIEA
jgi:hypothetical protein